MLSWRETWASHGVREAPDLGREGRAGVLDCDLPWAGGRRVRGRCSAVMVALNHFITSCLCFISGAQRGQVHAHAPEFGAVARSQARLLPPPCLPCLEGQTLSWGPGPPGRTCPRSWEGQVLPMSVWGVRAAVPHRGCQDHGRRSPAGFSPPLPSAVSVPMGEACPPWAEAVGLCAGGRPVPLPTSGRGTAGSRGGGCPGGSAPTNIKQAIAPHQERLPGERGRKASQNLQWRLSWTRPMWAPSPGAPALQPSRGMLGLQGSPGLQGGGPRRGPHGHRAGGMRWRRELGPERLSGTSESGLGARGAAKPCLVNRGLGNSEGVG